MSSITKIQLPNGDIYDIGESGTAALTLDDYLTDAEIEEIVGEDIIWDGTVV